MGWLTGWSKRQPITLTGGSDGAQTDFQLKLSIAYDSDMQSDFDDLRFTDADGETLIDAWLEDKTDGTSADAVVEFPSTPANGDTQTYYMYYGKSDALDDWDIGATFLLGDDFNDGVISNEKWPTTIGTPSESDGQLHTDYYASGTTVYTEGITSYAISTEKIVIEWKMAGVDNHKGVCYSTYGHAMYGSSDDPGIEIYLQDSGNDITADGYDTARHWNTLGTSDDSWHTYKMIWDGSNAHYSYDGGAETLQAFTFTPSNWKIGIGNNGFTSDVAQDVDNIRVSKYAANPPTYEFGSEQNAPSGLSMAVVMHHLKQQRIS